MNPPYFVPDPLGPKSCTIGGNVAEKAGAPHTLACGVTTNPIAALDADFASMRRVHDAFHPESALSPSKVFSISKGRGEIRIEKKESRGARA